MISVDEHHLVNPHQDIVPTTQKKRKKSSIYYEIVDSHETNLLFILRFVTLYSFGTLFSSKF